MSYGPAATVHADLQGLDRLRKAAREESPEALREAARQFEALFIQQMLKNMREASFGDELFDNDQSKLYQGMFDQQVSIHMTEKGGIGLADLLIRQLGGEPGPAAGRAASLYAGNERP